MPNKAYSEFREGLQQILEITHNYEIAGNNVIVSSFENTLMYTNLDYELVISKLCIKL